MTLGGTFNVDANNTPTVNTVGMGDAILSATVKEDLGGGMNITANTTLQTNGGRSGAATGNGYSFAFATPSAGTVTLKNYLNGGAGLSAGISATNDMNTIVADYKARTRLEYALPTFVPGLSVAVRYDNTATAVSTGVGAVSLNDQTTKFGVTYANGPLSVGFSGDKNDSFGDYNASYDFGVAKAALYRTNPLAGAAARTEMTVVAPFGATTVGVHSITGSHKGYGFVASYALSKRTALSFNYTKQTLGNTAALNGTNNTRIRLSHSF